VHFDPETVSGPVPECLAQVVPNQRVPRGGIDREAGLPWRDARDRTIVRLEDRALHLTRPRAGPTDRHSARKVDAV
jgi:hypothetical protein